MRLWKHGVLLAIALVATVFPGCGGCPLPIGIPSQPPQALIDAACKDLTVTDGIGLQILFKHFDDILLDGVHNGDT